MWSKSTQSIGFHFHAGILNTSASKHTLVRKVRAAFKEWEGKTVNVQCHKAWPTICSYLIKEDKEPLVWGKYSLEQIVRIGEAKRQHRRVGEISHEEILKRLESKKDWYQVYDDDIIRQKIINHLPRLKDAYRDLQTAREIEGTIRQRIREYLEKHKEPPEYHIEQLEEKYLLIDWTMANRLRRTANDRAGGGNTDKKKDSSFDPI